MVEEVKLRRKYLNSGDVFILDLGLELYQVGQLAQRRPFTDTYGGGGGGGGGKGTIIFKLKNSFTSFFSI